MTAVVDAQDFRKTMNHPLVKSTDMTEEMRTEAMETIVTAIEKFPGNSESAAKWIKEGMDKKYGPHWHCVVGEGYSFDITYEVKNVLYMFCGAQAVLLFKAVS